MRDYQAKQNVGALPDSNSATKLGASEATSMREESKNAVIPAGLILAPQDGTGEDVTQFAQSLFIHAVKSLHFADVGAVNTIELVPISGSSGVTLPPVSDAYTNLDGAHFTFDAAFTNTIAGVTVSIGQTAGAQYSALSLVNEDGSALTFGDISTSIENEIRLNLGSNRFELVRGAGLLSTAVVESVVGGNAINVTGTAEDPVVNADNATNVIVGVNRFATNAEAAAGTSSTLAMSPNTFVNTSAGIVQRGTIRTSNNSDTQAGISTSLAVTPNSLASLTSTTDRAGLVEKSTSGENVAGVATDVSPDVAGVKEMIDTHAATVNSALEAAYPVGTIYHNSTDSTNPGTLLGIGTWIAISAGRMLLGVGTGGGHTITQGQTGGAIDVALIIANLAAHVHTFPMREDGGNTDNQPERGSGNLSANGTTTSVGSGTPFSILNPFLGVNIFERIV